MQEKKRTVRGCISRRTFLKQAGALAAVGLVGVVPKRVAAAKEIPVGSLLDATGPINIYGLPMIDSTRLAIDHINAKGGVLGQPLKLIEYDTQSTNDLYVQYANELILKHKVAVIMGGITSASREAIRPTVIDRHNMIYFYNEEYEGGVADKLVFCTGAVPEQKQLTLIPWMMEKYGKKIYTIAADYNFGWISAKWVRFYAKKYGAEVVGEEFIPLEISEFSTTLAKIQAAKPDWICSLLVGGNHISFYRQWAAMGLKEKYPVGGPTVALSGEQVVLSPDEGEGLLAVLSYFQELDNPANKEFVALWHKRYGEDYPYITDSANVVWIGWHLWAMAVNKAGTLETNPVIAALESGLEFDAPEGRVRLDPGTHHLIRTMRLGRVNRKHGFDVIKDFGTVELPWHQETYDLVKNPKIKKQFEPKID